MADTVTLEDCPPGLFLFNGHLCFKSEYYSTIGEHKPDAYVVSSGEYFWGGAKSTAARNALQVLPVDYPAPTIALDNHSTAYFENLVAAARVAAAKAVVKFPQPNYVTLKIAEEAGEVVRAAVHYAEGRMQWPEVESEIIQLLAMLIRFVTEGDQVNGIRPPAEIMVGAAPDDLPPVASGPYHFFEGPWENSEFPCIVKDDQRGGDPKIVAVIKQVYRPDDLHELCRKTNDSLDFIKREQPWAG